MTSSSSSLTPDLTTTAANVYHQHFNNYQFYQNQQLPPLPEPNVYEQPPFLAYGPLMGAQQQQPQLARHTKSIEKNSPEAEGNSYKLYRPSIEENPKFIDMQPPLENQNESNYYAMKPRKHKKFMETNGKFVNINESKLDSTNSPPVVVADEKDQETRQRDNSSESSERADVEDGDDGSRLDFQMHGNMTDIRK